MYVIMYVTIIHQCLVSYVSRNRGRTYCHQLAKNPDYIGNLDGKLHTLLADLRTKLRTSYSVVRSRLLDQRSSNIIIQPYSETRSQFYYVEEKI